MGLSSFIPERVSNRTQFDDLRLRDSQVYSCQHIITCFCELKIYKIRNKTLCKLNRGMTLETMKLGFTHATPWMTEYSHHAHEGEDSGQITHMS